jgi:putative oxidoreductase
METRQSRLHATAPYMLSIMRIIVALLFIEHGTQKLLNFPPLPPAFVGHLPPIAIAGGIIEAFGGLLILFGLLVRPTAFILAGEMAFAYFTQHAPHGFFPFINKGEPAILFCFIYLYLLTAGGGAWSIDNLFGRRRSKDNST